MTAVDESTVVSSFFEALRLRNEKAEELATPGHKGDSLLESQVKELDAYIQAYLRPLRGVWPKTSLSSQKDSDDDRLKMRVEFQDAIHFYEAVSKSLGKGGLFIKTDKIVPINTLLALEVVLLKEDIRLNLSGKVIWISPKGSSERPMGLGVKLHRLSSVQRQILEDFKKGELGPETLEHLSE